MERPSHARSLWIWINDERVNTWTIPARDHSTTGRVRVRAEPAAIPVPALHRRHDAARRRRARILRQSAERQRTDTQAPGLALHAGVVRCLRFTLEASRVSVFPAPSGLPEHRHSCSNFGTTFVPTNSDYGHKFPTDHFKERTRPLSPASAGVQARIGHAIARTGRLARSHRARTRRIYAAQQCFGVSDEGIEDAIYDSQSIRAFVVLIWAASRRRTRRPCLSSATCLKPEGSRARSSTPSTDTSLTRA